MDHHPTPNLRRGLIVALLGLGCAGLLMACGSSTGTPTPAPGSMPVTFVYVIDGPAATVAHTSRLQVVDAKNILVGDLTLKTVGTVDTGTLELQPGNYSAFSWNEKPASPDPVLSTKCGSPFTVDPGQALVVTITAARLGVCLTDTLEPNASPASSSSAPASSPPNPRPS